MQQRKRDKFPEERDTQTDVAQSARPAPTAYELPRMDSGTWRPRTPLESTTYTLVPPREDAPVEEVFTLRRPFSSKPPRGSDPPAQGEFAHARESGPIATRRNAILPGAPDACAEDDAPDLSPHQWRRIDELFAALRTMTYYELLRIHEGSDRDALRYAYFSLVAAYHPDRFFGKRIGGFARKIQQIFARLNDAYDTLHDPIARARYDAALAEMRARIDAIDPMIEESQGEGPITVR
jgi:hypothetical protein